MTISSALPFGASATSDRFKKQNPSPSRIKKMLDISIIPYYNALRKEVKPNEDSIFQNI